MENEGGEQQVDHDPAGPASPPALLELLIARLTEPAAVLDESRTVVAANDAFETLGGADTVVGEPLTAAVPTAEDGSFDGIGDEPDEHVTVRTADDRVTEFGFVRHGSHILCVGHDTTERQRLAALQTATRELLGARTREEVATEIVETATDVLGLSGATVYLFDAARNVLWPAGVAGESGGDARQPVGGRDEGVVREVFLAGTATTVAGGDLYQPLGDHGVLHTVGDGTVSQRRVDAEHSGQQGRGRREERPVAFVDRLAGSARDALERVDHEATLREREASQRDHAARAAELDRLLSMTRGVQRALADADSVSAIEQAVCVALTEPGWLSFAWVGRTDGDTVEPRAWSGRGSDYLDDIVLSTADARGPPGVQTAVSGRPTTVDNVAEAIGEHQWARPAIARDLQSVVSVPLRADGVDYGVLTAYADHPVEWADGFASVFGDLGDSVATAIGDRERLDRLAGDTTVEVELTVTAPDGPLARLAGTLGTELCCDAVVPGDGTMRCFLSVPGADSETVADAAASLQPVDSVVTLPETDRYELVVRTPTVLGRVVDQGGRLERARHTDGDLSLTVTLAADTDLRAFVDRLADGGEDVQLTARRHRPATRPTHAGIRPSLEAALTDRQLEALRTAYNAGFFEWPRETTGEGVAEMLGVAQPTANRHLRVSQRKLLELVFEES